MDSRPLDEPDDQDRAETLDETHLVDDGGDIANFDDIDDVLDVTSAEGDGAEEDEDDAWAADWSDGDGADREEEDERAPLTRLEDRPESEAAIGAPGRADEDLPDDPDQRPAALEASMRAV